MKHSVCPSFLSFQNFEGTRENILHIFLAIEKPCCYSSDHRNANCMWKAFERLVGWSIGNIYEVSAMNTRRNYNFDMAMEQWKGSSKVLLWALFIKKSEIWAVLD